MDDHDLDAILRPIAPDKPAGESLRFTDLDDEIEEASREDPQESEASLSSKRKNPKVADWPRVVHLCRDALTAHSKDLRLAALLVEGLTRTSGLIGLRDGLEIFDGLVEHFWLDLYPELEPDDSSSRLGPYDRLDGLAVVVSALPLLDDGEPLCLAQHPPREQGRDNPTGTASSDRPPVTAERWDRAELETPDHELLRNWEAAEAAVVTLGRLETRSDERFRETWGPRSERPSLGAISEVLGQCRDVLLGVVERRGLRPRNDPQEHERVDAEADEDSGQAEAATIAEEVRAPVVPPAPEPSTGSGAPPGTVAEARQRMINLAWSLDQLDPGSAAPGMVVRALALADLIDGGPELEPHLLAAPDPSTRRRLRGLEADQQWGDLLIEAERALARPEGRGWLDAHRAAIIALEAMGRPMAVRGSRQALATLLVTFPGLADASLDDGSPAASGETIAWLAREGLRPTIENEAAEVVPPLGLDDEEAIKRLAKHAQEASSERARFERTLALAERCLESDAGRSMALPLFEGLTTRIASGRLERWDPGLASQALAGLYRASRLHGELERSVLIYHRICRLDPVRAATLDPPP